VPGQKQNGVTKQERVYRVIRERILRGTYGPGYRVVIDALAEEFAVSALPVREAIRRLEAEGLVIYRPNAGAQVAPADPGLFEI
jgi:DNA-binding GntR family transcriptional regulator